MFKKEKKKVTLQKFRPVFITTDGVEHRGFEYNWGIAERLSCSVPEYIMIDINSDGYIEDDNEVMYPLSNIISIKWELVDEKTVEDIFKEYQIFVRTLGE